MHKTILITGGAGFVGSTISLSLKKKYPDYKVYALDNLKRRGSELNIPRLKNAGVEFVHGDVRTQEDLDAFEKLDCIIDASANPSVLSGINSSIYPLVNSNLVGTVNCLELADKHKSDFIFLSTSRIYPIKKLEDAAYEEKETRFVWKNEQQLPGVSYQGISENFPLDGSRSFYGTTKLASELLIQEYNELKQMRTVINRCGVISGPWQMGKIDQGVIVLWLAQHYFKKQLSYIGYGGTGKQMRDVMHVDDLFDLVDYQIHNMDKVNGEILNAGGGIDISFSLQELTKLCEEITGNKITINSIKENRAADIRIYVTDNTKVSNLTGWKPKRDLKQLLQETIVWMKENEESLKQILT